MSAMSELRPTEILLSEAQIQKRVAELALDIRKDFPDDLHVIAVLKGAFIFLSDLARAMPGHVSLDFMAVSSYAKGTTSSGEVKMVKDLETPLDDRFVVGYGLDYAEGYRNLPHIAVLEP